ncbi:type II toxin-antitoxin system VapC family toxin [Mitsuaria sp. CC2]|uniref:type II toxin-antitoxin system VapC family toxin n=1 Tax=Mitsuaria sp. CC2 TaxID=3029186 RepID=UPI003B8B4CB8
MRRVVVDTSVWIDHFRRRNPALLALLEADVVLAHPMIIGELRCGSLPQPRGNALSTLDELDQSAPVSVNEVIRLIEDEEIFGKGCGLVDMSLLMSTLKTPGARLWASDKSLAAVARQLGIAHEVPPARTDRTSQGELTAACPTA